jgi:hypothetical protein
MTLLRKIRAFAPRIDYRHPLTLAISITATVCLILVASLWAWEAYANRTMRKLYPGKDLTDIGLRAGLRTERIDGSVQYVFAATPLSDATKDRLDEVIRRRGNDLNFFLDLEDDGGFELCHATVS